MNNTTNTQKGFTLLEVLVAFSILSITIGTVYRTFSTGLIAQSVSAQHNTAVIVAKSIISQVGSVYKVTAGEWKGTESNKFSWSLFITPTSPSKYNLQESHSKIRLYDVNVTVEWAHGDQSRRYNISTLRPGFS